MWRDEPAEVRKHYFGLAETEKSTHRQRFPGYKCSPRKSADIKKRKGVRKVESLITRSSDAALQFPFIKATGSRESLTKTKVSPVASCPTSVVFCQGSQSMLDIHTYQAAADPLEFSPFKSNSHAVELEYGVQNCDEPRYYNTVESKVFDDLEENVYSNDGTNPILDDEFYAGYCDALDSLPLGSYLDVTDFSTPGAYAYINDNENLILDDEFYANYCDALDNIPLDPNADGEESFDCFSSVH